MKYSKNRKYRDQEKVIEKEIISVTKKVKKSKKKKGFFAKLLSFFKW